MANPASNPPHPQQTNNESLPQQAFGVEKRSRAEQRRKSEERRSSFLRPIPRSVLRLFQCAAASSHDCNLHNRRQATKRNEKAREGKSLRKCAGSSVKSKRVALRFLRTYRIKARRAEKAKERTQAISTLHPILLVISLNSSSVNPCF